MMFNNVPNVSAAHDIPSAFEGAGNFLANTLQIYCNIQDDINCYLENQSALGNPEITLILGRLGKTVKRYEHAILIYNLFIDVANFINPNKETIDKLVHRRLPSFVIYKDDLERLNKSIPNLAVIKILLEKGFDITSDKVIEWLSTEFEIASQYIKLAKDYFVDLLSQQR